VGRSCGSIMRSGRTVVWGIRPPWSLSVIGMDASHPRTDTNIWNGPDSWGHDTLAAVFAPAGWITQVVPRQRHCRMTADRTMLLAGSCPDFVGANADSSLLCLVKADESACCMTTVLNNAIWPGPSGTTVSWLCASVREQTGRNTKAIVHQFAPNSSLFALRTIIY